MKANDIGAIIIEPGASLDYFTGVQWWRSERLTGTVIPASGDPIIVTPFFEKPSVEESLGVPAEIRTWKEDEEPLKLVADFLRERGLAECPDRDRGDQPLLHPRPAVAAAARRARIVSANPVVRGCRMIKTDAELALMQAASDITIAAFAYTWPRLKAGHDRRPISTP